MFGSDLIGLFESRGRGVFGSTLFLGSKSLPKAGTVLTVIETGGMAPSRVHNRTPPAIRRPGAQISVRSDSRTAAAALAGQAYADVCDVLNMDLNGTRYLAITPRQEPFDMGTEDDGRIKVGFNVLGEVAA